MSSSEATEKIEQLVFDENKVVTYKLLSSKLSVHVNKAKQLLNEYITNHCTKGKNDLNVYYAVSGFQKYNGHKIHKLSVVSKDKLEEIKKSFSALSSVHIYSIQKCSSVDECSLYTSDYLFANSSNEPNVFSAIKHPALKIRENRTVRKVESNSDNRKTTTESQVARKTEQKSSAPAQKKNALFTTWQKKEEHKNKTAKEQNGLLPTVSKSDDNAAPEKNTRSPPKAAKVADKGNKNNIMNLFSKQAVKSTSRTNAQNLEKSVSENNVSSVTEKEEKQERKAEKEEVKREEERTGNTKAMSKKKETSQKKRQKQKRSHEISEDDSDDEWKKPKKKHKRIVAAFSDSESESEEKKDRAQRDLMDSESPVKVESNGIEEDDEEEPIPPTPDKEEPIPSALLASAANGKRKKLKLVSKTFEDEDGFLVTQKVKEYVTDSEGSDNEAAPQTKVAPKPAPKPDIKKNFVNKKQSSLMSFFKQK